MALRAFVLLTCASCSLAGCGGNRADSLVPDLDDNLAASLIAATAGMPNGAVTESNRLDFCQELFSLLADSYERAVEQALQIDDSRVIRILGNANGYALSDGSLEPVTMPMKFLESSFILIFHNYSSSGRLYLAGKVYLEGLSEKMEGHWKTISLYADTTQPNIIEFAGQYRGRVYPDRFPVAFDSLGNMLDVRGDGPFSSGSSVEIISGGQAMKFDPYARNDAPVDSSGADSISAGLL